MEQENRYLVDENETLRHKIIFAQKNLSNLIKSSEPTKQRPIKRSFTMCSTKSISDMQRDFPSEETEEEKITHEDIENNPNVELFLEQIKGLKELCKIQGEALLKFQETMESTKGDNDKLQHALIELENEKKELSEVLLNSGVRSSMFDYTVASPVAPGSFDSSSMFISTLDGIDIENDFSSSDSDNYFRVYKRQYNFIEFALHKSLISALKL